jgi:hypothetical protein
MTYVKFLNWFIYGTRLNIIQNITTLILLYQVKGSLTSIDAKTNVACRNF